MKHLVNFLLVLAVLGNQIWFQASSISSAAIQPASQINVVATTTPTPTPTEPPISGAYPPPVTSTPTIPPTPVVTQTPVPAEIPPVTPPSDSTPQGIQLFAEPAIYIEGKPITLTLNINLTQSKAAKVGMAIKVPDGIHSTDKSLDAAIDGNHLLNILVNAGEDSAYSFSWIVDDAVIKPPFEFAVTLTQDDGEIIDYNSVVIGAGQYQADSGIGKLNTISTANNAVNLTVPGEAIDNLLAFDVRSPSLNKMPSFTLSGNPIEIIAVDTVTAKNVTSFKKPLTLTMKYDPEAFQGHNEENLSLFYFNESLRDWYPINTIVDTKSKTLTAQTDHLTVFDYNINDWQFRNLPSVDTFQVSDFTGAGTYSMGLWTPPGTAGFQPNLTLSYNSQVVDESRAFTQASWVGMGWSLDTPAITVNFHETESNTNDDTFYLSLNGVSGLLLPISSVAYGNGYKITYNTQNQSFIKVVQNTNTNPDLPSKDWTVYSKDGSVYYFSSGNRARTSTQGCAYNDGDLNLTWRWSITWAKDKYGNQINYEYYSSDKKGTCLNDLAIYPQSITYANNHYRIYFDRGLRTDYKDSWSDVNSKVLFSKYRLTTIWIQYQAENSPVWSDTTNSLRQYGFAYGDNTSNVIYPNLTWGGTHTVKGALTLVSITEKQGIATNPATLKPTSFYYEDKMHLTKVDNGQGGQVQMQYEQWRYFTDSTNPILVDQNNGVCTTGNLGGWSQVGYEVKCEGGQVQFDTHGGGGTAGTGKHVLKEEVLKPGGSYRIALNLRNIADPTIGTAVVWQLVDTSNNLTSPVAGNARVTGTTYQIIDATLTTTADFDPSNMYLQVQCDLCKLSTTSNAWQVKLFPSYYRVVSRTVTDAVTNRVTTSIYSYDNAAPNVWENSETIRNNGLSYFGPWREYRGNAFTRVVDAENVANYTWYYQNDYLKGMPYHSLTAKEFIYNDFENLPINPNTGLYSSLPGWQPTSLDKDRIYAGNLYSKEFDTAAYVSNPNQDWSTLSTLTRVDSNEIGNGKTVIAHIKFSQYKPYLVNGNYASIGTAANRKGEFGLISNTNQFFGVFISWDTTTGKYIARLCETTTDSCSTSGTVMDADFQPDMYYVLMIVVDSSNGSQVRLWREDNLGADSTVFKSGMSGENWKYRQRAYSSTLWLDSYSVSTLHSETENKYNTTLQYGNLVSGHPLSNSTLNAYYDLNVYWNQISATISRQYGTGRLWQGTRTDYAYESSDQNNTQYGNQTRVTVSSGGVSSSSSDPNAWTPLRGIHTYFYPRDDLPNSPNYYVVFPARTVTLDCTVTGSCDFINNGNLKAETLNIYDSNPNYSTAPTAGKLSIQRAHASDPNDQGNVKYAQTDFTYVHGNVNSVSTYLNYSTATTTPTGEKFTTAKEYDTWYFAYPLTETNPKGQITATSYDYKLGVPDKVTDQNGVVSGASYDVFGRMLAVCAPGDWDGTTCPTTGSTLNVVYSDFTGQTNPFMITLTQKVDDSISKQEIRYYDGTGKLIQVQQVGTQLNIGTANVVVDTIYDSFGRVAKLSKPFSYTGGVAYQTQAPLSSYTRDASTTVYDDWSRVSTVTEPDNTFIAYSYGFTIDADVSWSFQTTETNSKQQSTIQLQDAFGRVRKVIPPTENSAVIAPLLKYNYDALDRLVDVYQGSTNTHFVYDEYGRKTSMTDPDMGTWNYTYDPQNNLKSQTDARGCVTTVTVDGLNRLTNKSFSGTNCTSTHAIAYYYDDYSGFSYSPGSNYAIGQRTGMTDGSGTTIWEYDARGRIVLESKSVIDGTTDLGTYVTRWTYNAADLVTSMTYPNLETVTNNYLAQGVLNGMSSQAVNFITSTAYDLNGRITTLNLGLGSNTYSINYNYTAWNQSLKGGRLDWIKAGTTSNPSSLQYLAFDTDSVGNLNSIADYKSGLNRNLTQTQTFQYDALNRLKDATAQNGGGTTYGDYALETYTYTNTQTGNLTQKAGRTLSYAVQSSSCPSGALSKTHAVTSVTGTGFSASYCYDRNGNMERRTVNGVTMNLTYDTANNMISTSGSITESYIFDGDGNRVALKSGASTTVYIGNYFEVTIDLNIPLPPSGSSGSGCQASFCTYFPLILKNPIYEPPTHQEWRSYFYAGSNRVAMRVQGGTRSNLGDVYYMLGDFLGSTNLTVDSNTLALTELKYKPWGETRYESGATPTSFQYTGQRLDTSINLYWYNSRWYDSDLNRWIQPDSTIPDVYNPLDLDRYSYVRNNPVNFNDPSGHDVDCASTDTTCKNQIKIEKVGAWIYQNSTNIHKPLIKGISNLTSPKAQFPLPPPNIDDTPLGHALNGDLIPSSSWSVSKKEDKVSGIIWGANASGGVAIMPTAGLEELYILDSGDRGVYVYGGQASSFGAGANFSGYVGFVYNIESLEDYNGMDEGWNVTLAVGHGVTFGHFVSSSNPDIHGYYFGYAPGAKISAGWQIVTYSLVESHTNK